MAGRRQQPVDAPAPRIMVGRIGSAHGLQGWLRIQSYTEPYENILDYSPWQLRIAADWCSVEVIQGRRQGKGLVAKLTGCDDRDAAHDLLGAEIFVHRQQLPKPNALQYYWADLIGAAVVNCAGVRLGRVVGLLSTGANDVLRTQGDRERLIPFLLNDVVREVDLSNRTIRVDWEPDF